MASNTAVPVEECKGWDNPCAYCDKRFSSWVVAEEEGALDNVPSSPGIFMFALDSKQKKEIVILGINQSDIQKAIFQNSDFLRKQISNKKLKETKSTILVRWVVFENSSQKEACALYAHLQNSGILPRFTTKWPWKKILEDSDDFEYSEDNKKWYYPTKEAVWRKPKAGMIGAQAVQKCKGWTKSCAYCDSKFTPWIIIRDALERKDTEGGAPDEPGLCMIALNDKDKREVIFINNDSSSVKQAIRQSSYLFRPSQLTNTDSRITATVDARWMTVKNVESEEACFVYAHWVNSGTKPRMSYNWVGIKTLENSESFVYRHKDQQWCYEDKNVSRPIKSDRSREQKHAAYNMKAEIRRCT